jgi:hypothetical protein
MALFKSMDETQTWQERCFREGSFRFLLNYPDLNYPDFLPLTQLIDNSLARSRVHRHAPLCSSADHAYSHAFLLRSLSLCCAASLKSLLVVPDAENKWPIEEDGGCAKPNRKLVQRGATAAMTEIPELLKLAFAERVSLPLKETARLLGIDQKTLRGHVKAGNICFMTVGLGVTKLRREFTLSNILEFLERMRGRECPSISAPTRPTTTMISNGDILGFTGRRAKLIAERRKHSSAPKRSA